MQQQTGNQILDRAIGVIKLDVPTYEAIEHDRNATQQAAIVVAVVAIAGAIGGAGEGLGGIITGLLSAFLGWLIFAGLAYFFGTNIFGTPTTRADFEEVLRTVGYAQAPLVFAIVGFIPLIGWAIAFVAGIWGIVTAVIAIRQTLDFSTGRAIITAILAWIVAGIAGAILGLIFGIGAGIIP